MCVSSKHHIILDEIEALVIRSRALIVKMYVQPYCRIRARTGLMVWVSVRESRSLWGSDRGHMQELRRAVVTHDLVCYRTCKFYIPQDNTIDFVSMQITSYLSCRLQAASSDWSEHGIVVIIVPNHVNWWIGPSSSELVMFPCDHAGDQRPVKWTCSVSKVVCEQKLSSNTSDRFG